MTQAILETIATNPKMVQTYPLNQHITTVDSISLEDQEKIELLASQIDVTDVNSIIGFGADAQKGLTQHADQMLKGVRNKDTGPAGQVMGDIMIQVSGLGLDSLDPDAKPGWFGKMLKKLSPIQRFIQKYDTIENQIDTMICKLETEKLKLSRDIISLDGMYEEALQFFHDLRLYIAAGELRLKQINEVGLPAAKSKLNSSSDVLAAQELRDLQERTFDLERKIQDLMLTRTATMQLLPQLRMIQDVDKGLVTKIQTQIMTTIPIWKSQIAMAITLWRQQEAIKISRTVSDGTNDMLLRNFELLKTNSGAARREIERGSIDIETLRTTNANLISAIKEATEIATEGRRKRVESQAEMLKLENELKVALKDAANF